jgi:hypothetical protein
MPLVCAVTIGAVGPAGRSPLQAQSPGAPGAGRDATPPQSAATAAIPLHEMAMKPLMSQVIYPASDAIFYISSREPKTDAEWTALVSTTERLEAAARVMLLPTHRRDRDRWVKDAQLMIDAGAAAVAAVKKRDVAALSDLNDALYASCVTCHKDYRPGYGRP